MASLSVTATAAELLQLGKAIKFSLGDKPDNRRFTVSINDAPGGGLHLERHRSGREREEGVRPNGG
jgi:hypothetical protein